MIKNIGKTSLSGIYVGKVEDRNDPDCMGRVRIRVYGLHTSEIPSNQLQWFIPAYPINTGQINGIGDSGIPELGSNVLVLFIEGNILMGVYFGVICNINSLPNPKTYLENSGRRIIKTPSGHTIETTDKLIRITADDNSTVIELNNGTINIKAPNDTINIEAKNINIQDSTESGDVIINHGKFLSYFLNHIHPTGVGPSGTVMPATCGLKNSNDWYTKTIKVKK